ncbi:MAG: hypothetical protein O2884_14555, partial [Chloroflexi bacterium]|nr:hypothetical protein [Chloroflexota bacterium]
NSNYRWTYFRGARQSGPNAGQWRPSFMSYAELLERGGSLRKPFLPPEGLSNPVITNNPEDDSWLLSGSYPFPDEPGEGNSYSIPPVALWTATVDPKTSRLLTTETMIDFGVASYEYGPSGPTSGPQSNHLVWRIFDYDVDITITLPPDVTPIPTATPVPTA